MNSTLFSQGRLAAPTCPASAAVWSGLAPPWSAPNPLAARALSAAGGFKGIVWGVQKESHGVRLYKSMDKFLEGLFMNQLEWENSYEPPIHLTKHRLKTSSHFLFAIPSLFLVKHWRGSSSSLFLTTVFLDFSFGAELQDQQLFHHLQPSKGSCHMQGTLSSP